MSFEDIIGNRTISDALKNMADSSRVPHAILFHENEGGGALAMVNAFISYLNSGRVADVHYTFPITSSKKVSGKVTDLTCDMFGKIWRELLEENPYFTEAEFSSALGFEKKIGAITVAEGRSILQKLSLSSMTEGYRAVVIWLPERMNQSTANMLLKAIEEPAPDNIFLLISHSPENVLQTIISRCQLLRLLPLTRAEQSEIRARYNSQESGDYLEIKDLCISLFDNIIARDYLGSLEVAEAVAALDSREKQKSFCGYLGECLRKIYFLKQGMIELSGVEEDEEDYFRNIAEKTKEQFCSKSASAAALAMNMIDRNVSQKIVMCNLAGRMFTSV